MHIMCTVRLFLLEHLEVVRLPVITRILLLYTLFILTVPAAFCEPIIADHNSAADFDRIPNFWLRRAKELTIHYAHTSHGSQINSGLAVLEGIDAVKYSFARRASGTEGLPPVEEPPALRMYDGNPPETYITPDDYWDGESGQNRTRAVADTGNYDFSMWSWCGQQSSNSEATTQRYIDTLAQFEAEYPNMRFIYMTGHTDGSGETGNLNQRNDQVRRFCIANDKVLFDFADIESYDPDGNYYLNLACNDNCDYWVGGVQHNWADEWCAANPGSDLCISCSCAHSKPLNCNLKARAFWWMMARLAGWDGITFAECPNLDGHSTVNFGDFAVLADNWLEGYPGIPGDLDDDDAVDPNDLAILSAYWLLDCDS